MPGRARSRPRLLPLTRPRLLPLTGAGLAGSLLIGVLLLPAGPEPGRAQSEPAPVSPSSVSPAGPAPELQQIGRKLDALGAAVSALMRRMDALERQLQQRPAEQAAAAAPEPPAAADVAADQPPPVPVARPVAPPDRADARPPPPAAGPAVGSSPPSPPPAAGPTAGTAAPPAARPGELEVDEEAIDRALERVLVETGVLLLPFGQAEIQPSFSYTRRETDLPVRIVENGTAFIGERRVRRDELETSLALRVGLPLDSQAEFRVPFKYVDQSTVTTAPRRATDDSGSGIGDISVGIAKTLLRERSWRPDVVARLRWDTATGEQTDNDVPLGGGFHELAGSLSLVKRVDPMAFTSTLGYEAAFESDDIDPGNTFFTSLGTVLAVSPGTSLRFVLDADFSDETEVNGTQVPGSDDVVASFTIGGSTVLGRGAYFDLAGVLGLTDRAPDFAIRAGLPIRFGLPFR